MASMVSARDSRHGRQALVEVVRGHWFASVVLAPESIVLVYTFAVAACAVCDCHSFVYERSDWVGFCAVLLECGVDSFAFRELPALSSHCDDCVYDLREDAW